MSKEYQDDILCEHSYYDKSNCPYCRIKELEAKLIEADKVISWCTTSEKEAFKLDISYANYRIKELETQLGLCNGNFYKLKEENARLREALEISRPELLKAALEDKP